MATTYTTRILHISDLHFRSAHPSLPEDRQERVRREEWRRERVLGDAWVKNLQEISAGAPPIDFVCITGDIADWGLDQEYARATIFIERLLSHLHIDNSRLFVVPGNHDINRRVKEDSWRQLRSDASRVSHGALSEWMAGGPAPFGMDNALRDAVLERSASYRRWVEFDLKRPELLPSRSHHGRLGYRSTVRLAGRPFPIHVIGFDSAWLAGDDHDTGKLLLTENQVGQHVTDNGQPLEGLRLALVHHPLTDLGDAAESRRLLADHVDVLLRGHQHSAVLDRWSDPDRRLLELAAGCLYEGDSGNQFPNAFQVIDVITDASGHPLKYDILFRGWSPHGYWFDDASLYREARHGRLSLSNANPVPAIGATEPTRP